MQFFAACPKGLEELLATELAALGGAGVKQTLRDVGKVFKGSPVAC